MINKQIVDNCDLLVGVFWTRIGTPTGVADSGTIEEIQRAAKAGKQVMLYFSNVGIDPDSIDFSQYERLKEFKLQTYPNGLIESFKSQIDSRDKLFVKAEEDTRLEISARVYADSLPTPLQLPAQLDIRVEQVQTTLDEAVPNWETLLEEARDPKIGGVLSRARPGREARKHSADEVS